MSVRVVTMVSASKQGKEGQRSEVGSRYTALGRSVDLAQSRSEVIEGGWGIGPGCVMDEGEDVQ